MRELINWLVGPKPPRTPVGEAEFWADDENPYGIHRRIATLRADPNRGMLLVYTTQLTQVTDFPGELVIVNIESGTAIRALEAAARGVDRGRVPVAGPVRDGRDGLMGCWVRTLTPETVAHYLPELGSGGGVPVRHLVIPDREGRLPWHPDSLVQVRQQMGLDTMLQA